MNYILIPNIWYFNDDNEWDPAKLGFDGYSFEINTYKNGKPYQKVTGSLEPSRELTYRIIESDGMTVTIDDTGPGKLRLDINDLKN
jgi:hypothetical protein